MDLRPNSRNRELNLNITPLIDIVFLLLIFFMVTTNFNKITKISLQLPEVQKDFDSSPNEEIEKINITITAEGNYFINDTPIINNQKKTLMSAINNISNNNNKLPFIISGDGKAPHQAVVTALDAAGELGFVHIKIAAVKDS